MKRAIFAGLPLYYDAGEDSAARLIGAAVERSVALLEERWGLHPPPGCRVYVMTSWAGFLFHAAPGVWKAYVALIFPLLARRARETWEVAGGWALPVGRRVAVGVKPPRLIEIADRSLGARIFRPDRTVEEVVETVACHELTHAFTFHLRLPGWLQEGLATLAMERCLGRPLVRPETLTGLGDTAAGGAQKLRLTDPKAIVDLYARGYWLARRLDEAAPELLRSLFERRMENAALEACVAGELGIAPERLWAEVDDYLRGYFTAQSAPA